MARPHPHKRAARLAAISILSVARCGGGRLDGAAGQRGGGGVDEHASGGAAHGEPAGGAAGRRRRRPTAGRGAAPRGCVPRRRRAAATRPSAAATVDAGMRFTMAGVICAPPARHGRGRGAAPHQRGRADLEPLVRGRAGARRRGGRRTSRPSPSRSGPAAGATCRWRRAAPATLSRRRRACATCAWSPSTAPRTPTARPALVGVLRRAAATVAGLELAPPAGAMTTKPTIVTRAQWGANESLRSGLARLRPRQDGVRASHRERQRLHAPRRRPAVVRGVYAYHTRSLHWSDVGYNFLVDRYGTIYEGRYGGVTRGVIGAQVLGFNTGSTGVSVMGTFTSATPPSAVVTALERLLAWKLDVHHVDPLGTGTLVCGYGQKFRDRAARDVPRDRRPSRRQLHGLSRRPALRAAAQRAQGGRAHRAAQDLRLHRRRPGDQPQRRRRARHARPSASRSRRRPTGGSRSATTPALLVRHIAGEGTAVRDHVGRAGTTTARSLPDGVYTLRADATSADGRGTRRDGDRAPGHGSRRASRAPPWRRTPSAPTATAAATSPSWSSCPGESGTARVSVIAADGTVVAPRDGLEGRDARRPSASRWDGA